MKIIAGKYKGRKIDAPVGKNTKPTTSKVREGLFNILLGGRYDDLEDKLVLDLFCGTGALGFEALSRGAKHVILVDNDSAQLANVESNAKKIGIKSDITVIRSDAASLPKARNICDVVFIDPPYESEQTGKVLKNLISQNWVNNDSLVIIETSRREDLNEKYGFQILEERVYGKTKILFLKKNIELI